MRLVFLCICPCTTLSTPLGPAVFPHRGLVSAPVLPGCCVSCHISCSVVLVDLWHRSGHLGKGLAPRRGQVPIRKGTPPPVSICGTGPAPEGTTCDEIEYFVSSCPRYLTSADTLLCPLRIYGSLKLPSSRAWPRAFFLRLGAACAAFVSNPTLRLETHVAPTGHRCWTVKRRTPE